MKQLKMLLLSSMVVFFTACGGGGSTPEDTTAPIITVNGENPITITQDVSYTDEGAIAVDDKDGSVKVITTGTVDTSTIGTYTITYTATDNAGNVATAIRTVHVVISFLTLDNTFNSDGIVVYNNPVGGMLRDDDAGYAITLDNAGNIYVTGHSVNTDDYYDMVIWKYTSNGELDTTFGTGGIVVHNNAAGGYNDDMGYGIALDSAGNVYVTGRSVNTLENSDMVIWKYTDEGTLDSIVVHSNAAGGGEYDSGIGIELDNIGNIFVTGVSINTDNYSDMVIWKYR